MKNEYILRPWEIVEFAYWVYTQYRKRRYEPYIEDPNPGIPKIPGDLEILINNDS